MPSARRARARVADGLDARRLAAAERQRAVRGRRSTIAFDLTCFTTRHAKSSARSSSAVGRALRHHPRLPHVLDGAIGFLHQQAAGDAAQRRLTASARPSGCQRTRRRVLLLRQQLERVGLERGRDQHLGEDLVHRLRQRERRRAGARPRCRRTATPVGGVRALPRLERVASEPDAARRVVLQDRDRRVRRASRNSLASASAASTSTTLLYESSLPCSGSATRRKSP